MPYTFSSAFRTLLAQRHYGEQKAKYISFVFNNICHIVGLTIDK